MTQPIDTSPAALRREAILHAGKCRQMSAKIFNENLDIANCVSAGDRLLYAAQLLNLLALAAEKESRQCPRTDCPCWAEFFDGKAEVQQPEPSMSMFATRADYDAAVKAHHHPEKSNRDERHLRYLLALRAAIPGTYFDDGEAHGSQHGISIDFMRDPVADIDAKLRALNVARLECSNMVAPADVPMPEPRRDAGALMEEGLRVIAQQLCHIYWGAGEPGCPEDIKAPNGEIFKLRCKKCGEDNPKLKWCAVEAPPAPADVPLPAQCTTALFVGPDGSEFRTISTEYDPHCAAYSVNQLRQYAEAYAKAAVAAERERCAKLADDQWVANPNISGGDAIRKAKP